MRTCLVQASGWAPCQRLTDLVNMNRMYLPCALYCRKAPIGVGHALSDDTTDEGSGTRNLLCARFALQ